MYLWNQAEKQPGIAAIITGGIVAIATFLLVYFTDKNHMVWYALIIAILFGSIISFGTVFIYGQKQSDELSRNAAQSADRVAIIDGRKITKDDLV